MRTVSPESAPPVEGVLSSTGSRRALAGFFVSGVLLSFLGAILPSWKQHLSSDYTVVGLYFLGLIVGLLASVGVAPRLLERKGLGWTLALACAIAGTGFLYLAFVSPPVSLWWRVGGLAVIGFSAGLLHTGVFHAVSPMYQHDPAATVNLAGILFGLGCLTVALLISGAFYIYTAEAILAWIAVIPALFGWFYVRARFAPGNIGPIDQHGDHIDQPLPHHPLQAILNEVHSPGAVLFILLLFFQFGNEWELA